MSASIITGPTGAIGIALINKLLAEKKRVYAICRVNSKRIHDLPESEFLTIIECNLDSISNLSSMLPDDEYDVFYHLAWDCTFGDSRNNIQSQVNNIQYTLDAIDVASKIGCKRFVGAGSQAEYGRCNDILRAATPAFPENGYGIAKLCAGRLGKIRAQQLGLDFMWTRILSVYGPHDGKNTLVSSLIRRLKAGEHIECTQGIQIWDYLYSVDAAMALFLIGEKGVSGKTYIIASGEARPLKEYIEIIREKINPDVVIGYGEVEYGPLSVMHLAADISELREDTGFEPGFSFEEGIDDLLELTN